MIVGGRGFDDLEALLGEGFDLDDETNLNSQVVRSKRTQVFADVSDNPHFASDFGGSGRIRGWICAPMIVGDRVIGVISVDKFEPDFYNEELAELATAFAAQAAIAIENARLLETERAAREQAETLRAAAHSLGSTLGVPEVFDLILSELRKVVPYESASVQQLDGNDLVIVGGHGYPNLDELLGLPLRLARPERSCPRAGRAARDAHRPGRRRAVRALRGPLRRGTHQGLHGRAAPGRRPADRHADARQLRGRLLHARSTRRTAEAFAAFAATAIEKARLPQRAPARPRARRDAPDRDAGAREDAEPGGHDRDDPRRAATGRPVRQLLRPGDPGKPAGDRRRARLRRPGRPPRAVGFDLDDESQPQQPGRAVEAAAGLRRRLAEPAFRERASTAAGAFAAGSARR